MTIVGRLTGDAVINTIPDGRKVVNFSVAVNDRYKPKEGEPKEFTTFFNCAFWKGEGLAKILKKGALLEITGRLWVKGYASKDGEAKASLNCHVDSVKILVWPKEVEGVGRAIQTKANSAAESEDTPF